MKTSQMKKLTELLFALEVENQRTVHLPDTYTIEDGLIQTPELIKIRENIKKILMETDAELLMLFDDGR
jgi:hypothetical protein